MIYFDSNTVMHNENNSHSEQILIDQSARLSKNCKILYEALLRGEVLSGAVIVTKYGMMEYRRRIADLRAAGVVIKENILSNGCKEWYL